MKFTDKITGQVLSIADDCVEILDANGADGAMFFARELDAQKAKSYDVKYPALKYRELFPVSNEAGAGAETISYVTYDQTGMAEYLGAYAKDLPRADVGGKETIIPVRSLGISVGYTTDEIRKSQRAGKAIPARKMASAVKGMETKCNKVAWFGDSEHGHFGLFTHPNIPSAGAPNGGGGSPLWINKTPDEILLDLNNAINDIHVNTFMAEAGNTVLLAPEQYAYISSTARSANSDTTILAYFLANNEHVQAVIPANECSGAFRVANGISDVDVIVAYDRSPNSISFEEPMPMLWQPEQRVGLEILVPAEASIGGFNAYYPLSLNILEGV